MGNVMIAPVGDNVEALFIGIKEFPTERVVLVTPKDRLGEAERLKKDLDRFKIPAEIKIIDGNLWEGMFQIFGEIAKIEDQNKIIVNVATGDKMSSCIATSAAFVNGMKAMGVEGDTAMLLPVLKFSYYKLLTDKKMDILKIIHNTDCCSSLEELSKRTGMSLPLVSYHVNGNLKSEGLKDLGLIETTNKGGRTAIALTTLGRLLVKGYV